MKMGTTCVIDASIAVPKDRSASDLSHGIPVTYVPARNTIFLSFALAYAEVLGAGDIFIGVNALDYSGYPDCRPEFISAFETLANLATASAVEGRTRVVIRAPLQHMTKQQIVQLGASLGVDYTYTVSCYDPSGDGGACGHCDACQLRHKGFHEAGVPDPTRYAIAPSELPHHRMLGTSHPVIPACASCSRYVPTGVSPCSPNSAGPCAINPMNANT